MPTGTKRSKRIPKQHTLQASSRTQRSRRNAKKEEEKAVLAEDEVIETINSRKTEEAGEPAANLE